MYDNHPPYHGDDSPKLDILDIVNSRNVSKMLTENELEDIGRLVVAEFDHDKNSRLDWENRYNASMKLALQVAEQKTFPWIGAANVKFPLLTIAALQFHSRAYPALIGGPKPVNCRAMLSYPQLIPMPQMPQGQGQQPGHPGQQGQGQPGQPPQIPPDMQKQMQEIQRRNQQMIAAYQKEKLRARRVAEHMSYQILEEDENWEEEMDKLLLIMAILGCAFKKTYFDPVTGLNISECVSPKELVVHYYTKSLSTSARISHIVYMSRNMIIERVRSGVFNELTTDAGVPKIAFRETIKEQREGIHAVEEDRDTPFEMIEQHRWLDLDGDGYKEPYIVTVRYETKQVMRIVARYTTDDIETNDKHEIVRITPINVFTKYSFIPSPDGGFYDLGFGALLGPINDSIDTTINQLLDAGSLSNAGGGFLGRGFKARKGDLKFRLNEWKQVDCTGDDLRKSVFPMPTREPSSVLFQLLSLLIDFGQQVAGAADILQGKNPGQNTPAETARTMAEQGMKVFNGIFKRVHRGFTQELRKLYRLNRIFLNESSTFYSSKAEESVKIFQADYSGADNQIKPSATPFYMSDSQRLQVAMSIREASHTAPGYNIYEVEKRYLEALKEPDIDEILPDPKGPNAIPPKIDPKIQVEMIKQQEKQANLALKDKQFQMKLSSEAEKRHAEVVKLTAEAAALSAEVQTEQIAQKLKMLEMMLESKKGERDAYMQAIELSVKMKEAQREPESAG